MAKTKDKSKKLPKKANGRPAFKPDIEELKKLLALQINDEGIAAWYDVTERTIKNLKKREPYRAIFNSMALRGKAMVKMALFDEGVNKRNTSILIWLDKTLCGAKEVSRQELTDGEGKPIGGINVYLPDNGRGGDAKH